MSEVVPTWLPDNETAAQSAMARFAAHASARTGRDLTLWPSLSSWARADFRAFWSTLLEFLDPVCDGPREPVCLGDDVERARFFPGLRLNYAENLLRPRTHEPTGHIVLTALGEDGRKRSFDRATLRSRVLSVAAGLQALGIGSSDRACALARNDADTITACLACAALGTGWSSVAPDLGPDSILARFSQLKPTVLFAHTHTVMQGQARDLVPQLLALAKALPSLRHVVLLDDGDAGPALDLPTHRLRDLEVQKPLQAFERLAFDHPLFTLFSSGTTGAPKCIVHGHGGTLLEHLKELVLHSALTAEDRLCFMTTTGWMMWNWLLSGLASDAGVVVFDGSPAYPESDSLLRRLADHGVTVFGTSPAFLQVMAESQVLPSERFAWPGLRAVLSTGSILYPEQHDFIQRAFGPVQVQSISGGSDIIGCFVLGNPLLPVHRGQSQCVSLGLDVRAATPEGSSSTGTGDLVCASPFPSRPVCLFGDESGERFHAAYFADHTGMWTHGDLIELTDNGGARILGRADGVLNIRGVRIGPAELYGVLARIPEIAESMAVDQADGSQPGGRRLILLVVLRDGQSLDKPLQFRIKRALRDGCGMTHVPAVIAAVDVLPQTHNAKRSERAVQDLLDGRVPRNLAALRNPQALLDIAQISDLSVDNSWVRAQHNPSHPVA